MSDGADCQYWWVNQSRAVGRGLMGDYLWAVQAASGAAAESARWMQAIQPGDLIFAYADGAVSAVGLALRTASEAARPAELAATGKAASAAGWHLPVRFFELALPLHPKPHMGLLRPLLPDAHAPLRGTGARNPVVYLAA